MKLELLPTDCNLSAVSLEQAAAELGVQLHDCVVWCSDRHRIDAQRVQALYGFELRIIPFSLMAWSDMWACQAHGRIVGSKGVF